MRPLTRHDRSRALRTCAEAWIDPRARGYRPAGARHPTIHRPPRPAPSARRRSATWPATCGGPGTRRPRTSSRRSTPSCGSRPATTRSACSARSAGPGSSELAGRRGLPASGSSAAEPTSTAYLTGDRWYQRQAGDDAPARDRLLLARSSASPRCCRSTPAASASSPATTSRPPATSASRSSASACSTGTATSSSRCPARAGSRRPTRSSTPTSCRSRCCARPTAPAPRSRSTLPDGPTWSPASGSRSVGRVPLLLLDSDVEGNPAALPRRHRPPLRRHQRAPAAPGAAARRRRRPRPARLLAGITGAPDARGVPHQRGPRRLPRPRADPRAHRRPRAARSSTSTPRSRSPAPSTVFTTHTPVPGRHRPVPARAGRAVLRRDRRRRPACPIERMLALGSRGLRGRRPDASSTWR